MRSKTAALGGLVAQKYSLCRRHVAVLSVKEATLNLKGPRPEGPRREIRKGENRIEWRGSRSINRTNRAYGVAWLVWSATTNEPVDLLAFDLV